MNSDSQEPDEDLDVIYFDTIESGKGSTWNATININGQPVMSLEQKSQLLSKRHWPNLVMLSLN